MFDFDFFPWFEIRVSFFFFFFLSWGLRTMVMYGIIYLERISYSPKEKGKKREKEKGRFKKTVFVLQKSYRLVVI